MILTQAEPIIIHLRPADGVCPQEYPIAGAHLLNSYCFDFEPLTFLKNYNFKATKRYYEFRFFFGFFIALEVFHLLLST